MSLRPHNARDGRCRYTWGAERCPAPGSIAVGRWWVCAEHREWAQAPGDALFAGEGRRALRVQQRRYGSPGATDEPVGGDGRTTEAGAGRVATEVAPTEGDRGSREAALRAIRAVLGTDGEGEEQRRRPGG